MRSALPSLLLAALLVTSGCQGLFGPSRPSSDQRALDAVNRSQAAAADVESYRFTIDGELEAHKSDEQKRVAIDGEGVVDVTEQRMVLTARARDTTRSAYVTGDTAYKECSRVGWSRENLSGSTRWLDYTPVGQQLALLELTDVYWRGTRSVNGTEVGVVEAYPTKEEIQSVAEAHGIEKSNLDEVNVHNITVTVWIIEETGRLLKASREVEMKRGGATGTATVTYRFTGYDEAANVSIPSLDEETFWETGCPGE